MAQIFNTYSEFVMPIGILTNKTNAEISIHQNYQSNLKPYTLFDGVRSSNHYVLLWNYDTIMNNM